LRTGKFSIERFLKELLELEPLQAGEKRNLYAGIDIVHITHMLPEFHLVCARIQSYDMPEIDYIDGIPGFPEMICEMVRPLVK
jgi:hypothetical protein